MTPKESPPTNKAVDSADGSDAHASLNRRRYRALAIVAVIVVLVASGTFLWWWTVGRWELTTSDAYVGADMAQVSALTVGTVKAVAVYAGQRVRQGDLLVELDASDAQIALAQAEASLAKAVRSARGLAGSAQAAQAGVAQRQSEVETARAQLQAADATLARARSELTRQNELASRGFVSPEALTVVRAALQTA